MLGGSTCVSMYPVFILFSSCLMKSIIDFMTYSRGSRDDFDRWASVTDDEGWSWDMLFPLMQKVRFCPSSLHYRFLTGNCRWRS